MGLLYWFCRCIPPLSLFLWIFVCYQALCGLVPFAARPHPAQQFRLFGCNAWELLYVAYSVAAHLAACVVFPLRLCWAVWQLTHEVRRARADALELARPYAESEATSSTGASSAGGTAGSATLVDDKASALSLSAGAQTPETPLSSRVGTPKMGGFEERVDEVVHAIILPSYKEDQDTMRETLSVLASHVLAKTSYDVRTGLSMVAIRIGLIVQC